MICFFLIKFQIDSKIEKQFKFFQRDVGVINEKIVVFMFIVGNMLLGLQQRDEIIFRQEWILMFILLVLNIIDELKSR